MNRFTDRVFMISGGARGLGEAPARRLVAEGGRVVIGDVLVEQGRRLAEELGPACTFQLLDVTSEHRYAACAHTRGKSAPGPAGPDETVGHQGKNRRAGVVSAQRRKPLHDWIRSSDGRWCGALDWHLRLILLCHKIRHDVNLSRFKGVRRTSPKSSSGTWRT